MPCPRPWPRALHRWRSALLVIVAVVLSPRALAAQAGSLVLPTSQMEDASVTRRGEVRARVSTSWTRWNELIGGPSGLTRSLGSAFSSDTFGTQVAGVASAQYLLRQLTGNPLLPASPGVRCSPLLRRPCGPLSLSAGRLTTNAAERMVVTPLTLEYGLTSRLQLSATLPIVQTRINVASIVDSTGSTTAGLNPALQTAGARVTDSIVAAQLSSGAQALQQRLQSCDANPTQTGCAALLADRAAATQLVSSLFAAAYTISFVYGGAAGAGQLLVPLAEGTVHQAVLQTINGLNQQLTSYLDSSYVTARPVGAAGVIGARDVTTLLRDPAYGAADTLGSFDRIGIGDLAFAVKLLAWDRWSDAQPGATRARLSLSAGVRLGTGIPGRPGVLYDVGTGDGHTALEGAVFTDLLMRDRYGLSGAFRYTHRGATVTDNGPASVLALFGTPFGIRAPDSRTLGDVAQLELQPLVLVGRALSLSGRYTLMHQAADRLVYYAVPTLESSVTDVRVAPGISLSTPQPESITAQRLGIGVSYSAIAGAARGHPPRWPLEIAFSHEETVSASGGVTPKLRRDQIEVRVHYQLLGRGARER